MSVQENLRLDEEFIAAWNARNTDRALSLLSDDITWRDISVPEPLRGKAAVAKYMEGWFSSFPDMHISVRNRLVTDDQVAAELEFSATHTGPLQLAPGVPAIPATGKKITGKGTYFVRIRNGKAVEVHSYPDAAGLLMQLGILPPPGK